MTVGPRPALVVTGVTGIGEVRAGDDLAALLLTALTSHTSGSDDRSGHGADGGRADSSRAEGGGLRDGDVLVISSKVVSKAEGRAVPAPDREALVAAETVRLVAARRTPRGTARIVASAAGPVMAAAGVDASNVTPGTVLLLPKDPDASARALRARLAERTGLRLGVVISDTAGRAWRDGQTDFALGAAGIRVVDDLRGATDDHGQPLEVTVRALADELAAAADLVKGKLGGLPAALVRGLDHLVTEEDGPGAAVLLRPAEADWFRHGHVEAVRAALDPAGDATGVLEGPEHWPAVPPENPDERLRRVLVLATNLPDPLTGPTDGQRFRTTLAPGGRATVTLADTSSDEERDGDGGQPVPAWFRLGALAQRIQALAWAEDLEVRMNFIAGPLGIADAAGLELTAVPKS